MAASFTGVGVGPGDPELITIGALRVLRAADRVFAPTMTAGAEGRAEWIVAQAAPDVDMERLVFDIEGGDDARAAAHRVAAERIVACLDAGERTAFVTLGDPNVYSTFHHLAELVRLERPAAEVRTVPGIMAFQALAARTGTVVTDGAQRLTVVTAMGGAADVEAALADPAAAVVIYKGGRHLPEIAARLAEAGRLEGAVVGELIGLPGERVGPVAEVVEGPAAYLASVIVPPTATA